MSNRHHGHAHSRVIGCVHTHTKWCAQGAHRDYPTDGGIFPWGEGILPPQGVLWSSPQCWSGFHSRRAPKHDPIAREAQTCLKAQKCSRLLGWVTWDNPWAWKVSWQERSPSLYTRRVQVQPNRPWRPTISTCRTCDPPHSYVHAHTHARKDLHMWDSLIREESPHSPLLF